MPSEAENMQYLYLVLTHGGLPTVTPPSPLPAREPDTNSPCPDRLGPNLRRARPQEGRSNQALVASQACPRSWRQADSLKLRFLVASGQALLAHQGTSAATRWA